MDKLRLFVAIELPSPVQEALMSVQKSVGEYLSNARWIASHNLHLTLQFMGNYPTDVLKEISGQLKGITPQFESFDFRLDGVGAFPSPRRPRIFWIGVEEGKEKVAELADLVAKALFPVGFKPEERKFHAHITLARFKKPNDLTPVIQLLDNVDIYPQPIRVDGFALFQSQLSPRGAEYSIVERFLFGKN